MDNFYRTHAALYKTLVGKFNPPRGPQSECVTTELPEASTVVSARIRPLLDEDVVAGFPCAIFPRAKGTGIADLHDLYNHPKGRPVLKVSKHSHTLALLLSAATLTVTHSLLTTKWTNCTTLKQQLVRYMGVL